MEHEASLEPRTITTYPAIIYSLPNYWDIRTSKLSFSQDFMKHGFGNDYFFQSLLAHHLQKDGILAG
jgi:hypothetical protein